MNTTLVLSTLIFIFTALAIVIDIVQLSAASRSRRIVIRRRDDDDTAPDIAFAAAAPSAGAFAGSPVAITGPVRVPVAVPVIARAAEASPAVASSGSRRAVYDFVPPPPRRSRPRNVHG